MLIDVVTLFPSQIKDFLNYSIIKRAIQDKKVEIKFHDLRKWAVDERGSVDARPYGGGLGMILRIEPVVSAIRALKILSNTNQYYPILTNTNKNEEANLKFEIRNLKNSKQDDIKELVVIFDARGEKYTQKKAFEFAILEHLILICGHYEGFDERILKYVDLSLSIGDFVLTGGEIPALVVVDSIVRLLPGVLKPGVVENESFSTNGGQTQGSAPTKNGKVEREIKGELEEKLEDKVEEKVEEKIEEKIKEYPQYTRPEIFEDLKVPEVLLSGDHGKIEKWRKG